MLAYEMTIAALLHDPSGIRSIGSVVFIFLKPLSTCSMPVVHVYVASQSERILVLCRHFTQVMDTLTRKDRVFVFL